MATLFKDPRTAVFYFRRAIPESLRPFFDGMRGIVQKEGEVIHVIIQKIVDYGDMLRRVGEMDFPHRPGPGDGATHGGGPDPRDKSWKPEARNLYWPPFAAGADPEEVVRIKSRNFH